MTKFCFLRYVNNFVVCVVSLYLFGGVLIGSLAFYSPL